MKKCSCLGKKKSCHLLPIKRQNNEHPDDRTIKWWWGRYVCLPVWAPQVLHFFSFSVPRRSRGGQRLTLAAQLLQLAQSVYLQIFFCSFCFDFPFFFFFFAFFAFTVLNVQIFCLAWHMWKKAEMAIRKESFLQLFNCSCLCLMLMLLLSGCLAFAFNYFVYGPGSNNKTSIYVCFSLAPSPTPFSLAPSPHSTPFALLLSNSNAPIDRHPPPPTNTTYSFSCSFSLAFVM